MSAVTIPVLKTRKWDLKMKHKHLEQITQNHRVSKQQNHGVNSGRLVIGSVISETIVVTSSGEGMRWNLFRKLGSLEGLVMFFCFIFIFLDNKEINLWLPTLYSKALRTFWMCWSWRTPKIKQKFIFCFPFSCFSSRQNWGGDRVNNIRSEPCTRVQSQTS